MRHCVPALTHHGTGSPGGVRARPDRAPVTPNDCLRMRGAVLPCRVARVAGVGLMLKRCLIAQLQALTPHWVSSLGCGSRLFMTKPIACILPTDCHHDSEGVRGDR